MLMGNRRFDPRRQSGFTVLEVMIAIAVIVLVASMAIPAYRAIVDGAKVKSAVSDLESISKAIDLYAVQTGHLPESLEDVGMGDAQDPWGNPYAYLPLDVEDSSGPRPIANEAALALLNRHMSGNITALRNLSDLQTLMLRRTKEGGSSLNDDYDFYSAGPDGDSHPNITATESRDDIVRADDGTFIGPLASYK